MVDVSRMSRARLFVLIDAFEQDMRALVQRYVLDHLTEEEVLGSEYERVGALRLESDDETTESIVHYLYLRQCYDVLNRFRSKLPSDIAEEVRSQTAQVDILVPVRNRVMHGRPLLVDDAERTLSCLQGFQTRYWALTKDVVERLRFEPTWEPLFTTIPTPAERVLHNLPLADYDETGLVGRGDDVGKIKALVMRRREPMITITGEGGIGKTALALEVAYSIVDDPACPFECVLWVSLKSEQLTAYGVRAISGAIRDITGAVQALGNVVDGSFSGSVKDLSELLQGIEALVVLDNLESTQGSEVIHLYDSLPETVSYLFTSRLGVGEIERRYPLAPLSPASASNLFRRYAKTRGQNGLASRSQDTVDEVLTRLRFSPLAIRWYVLSVEAGKEPVNTLKDQRELLEFCVGNVYDGLSGRSQRILTVLGGLNRPVAFDELAVLTDEDIDDLRKASQELSRGSLVSHAPDSTGGLGARISLTAAARAFLPSRGVPTSLAADVLAREQTYLKSVERRRADEESRSMAPGVVRVRSAEDEPTAHLLRVALSFSKRGDFAQADKYVSKARSLNPDFWEIERVSAFLSSEQGHLERATAQYRSALDLADSSAARGVVCYFFAGHLARRMRNLDLALPRALEAHRLLASSASAGLLGTVHIWKGEFTEGQVLLEVALEDAAGRERLIALTTLVESWRRWSESLLEDRRPLEAARKAHTGVVLGTDCISSGDLDMRMATAVVDSAAALFRSAQQPGVEATDVSRPVLDTFRRLELQRALYENTSKWTTLSSAVRTWLRDIDPSTDLSEIGKRFTRLARVSESVQTSADFDDAARLVGSIVSWRDTYGFIKHPDYPSNVFLHRGAFETAADVQASMVGQVVSFIVTKDAAERPRATSVQTLTRPAFSDRRT